MIVLMGKSCSGKTTIARKLEEKYGIKRVITYTTRKPRENEADGMDYNFVENAEFEKMRLSDIFGEYDHFCTRSGVVWYGSKAEEYTSDNSKCIVLTPLGVRILHEFYPKIDITVFYIVIPQSVAIWRSASRGDSLAESSRRYSADRIDFADAKRIADYMVDGTMRLDDITDVIYELANNSK